MEERGTELIWLIHLKIFGIKWRNMERKGSLEIFLSKCIVIINIFSILTNPFLDVF